jgi:hypothetical protein
MMISVCSVDMDTDTLSEEWYCDWKEELIDFFGGSAFVSLFTADDKQF